MPTRLKVSVSPAFMLNGQVVVPLLMRTSKAAKYLGVGKNKLFALWKAGKIKAKIDGNQHYYVTASLVAYRDSMADA